MTQRFSSCLQNVWLKEWFDRSWKIWLWELKFLKEKRTLRIEPFQKLTRWIEPSVLHDPKNWTFFPYITQGIGLSSFFKPFFNNSTQWLTLFWTWLTELNLSFQDDSKNWTYDMTQSTNWIFFKYDAKNWMFFEYDSQNWTTLFLNMTPRIEFFVNICFFFFKKSQIWTLFNMTQRKWTGFPKFDSKNWTLFTKGLKELDPKRLSDSNNKTFLWLVEVNFFLYLNQRN